MKNRLPDYWGPYFFRVLAALPLSAYALTATAQAVDDPWPALQQSYFSGKKLEAAPFIHLSAPIRAASGDQVPFAFSIDHPMTAERYIKSVTVLVDSNPVPLTAVFHFNPDSGKAEASTRIRFESDSPVHLVAESNDGRFYVNAVTVKASGGCSGPTAGADAAALAAAGKMKMALDGPLTLGAVNKAKLFIRHPMYTGLQRDLSTNGFRPAFYINKIDVSYNGKPVMRADTSIGISENPTIEFPFRADRPGALQVLIQDNTGATFRQSLAVGG
ncbi:MAG: Quinoprotein dehydrogenase-associated SoxYZ-like carrier [Massilia sp.]|jgi:sulfur-oxidizing protein SoxY|nr:Quinoprotein dehydrogenase-associated SoxYZ-like carrier [Massilia sp.]